MIVDIWKEVKEPLFTPGGDPVWECPNCGERHVMGIETSYNHTNICNKCGKILYYPWEKKFGEDTVQN